MSNVIAVTGATGAVGGLVADSIADLYPFLVVRDAKGLNAINGRIRRCSYGDAEAAEQALSMMEVLFMVSASESPTRREEHRTFIAAAARAGVRHIVYTSFSGAAPDATFTLGRDHFDAEQAIAESGMTSTILRDNFYLDVLPLFADEAGVIRGPAGEGRVAGVARADVADVAAAILRDPEAHAGATYTLTGPEALSFDEVAARAGAVLGRDLRFENETVEEAYASRRAAYPDTDEYQLDAWVSTYTAVADGSCAEVTGDVERVTGRAPRTLEDVLAR